MNFLNVIIWPCLWSHLLLVEIISVELRAHINTTLTACTVDMCLLCFQCFQCVTQNKPISSTPWPPISSSAFSPLQTFRIQPPMCITNEDVDFFLAVFNKAVHNYLDRKWTGQRCNQILKDQTWKLNQQWTEF